MRTERLCSRLPVLRLLLATVLFWSGYSPMSARADTLSVGSGTALNETESTAAEKIVEQIQRLADESRRGAPQFSLLGVVAGSGALWEVNGEPFRVTKDTIISGELAPGKMIEVRGLVDSRRPLTAREVRVHPDVVTSEAPSSSRIRMYPSDARMLR